MGPDRLTAEAVLRSCHGFLVDTTRAREVGVVDEIEIDPSTGRVVRLEVCGGWFGRRRRVVHVEDIEMIYPGDRRMVVSESVVAD